MAQEIDPSSSILEYMGSQSGHKCGYCKSKSTNFSHGMWAHRLTVGDYQDLIDRGWRRSGKYCYKPMLDMTCCPMYTIKCDALNLKLSKTQRKVLKRMHRYLSHGDVKNEGGGGKSFENESCRSSQGNQEYVKPKFDTKQDLSSVSVSPVAINNTKGVCTGNTKDLASSSKNSDSCPVANQEKVCSSKVTVVSDDNQANRGNPEVAVKVTGPNPSKPPCKKSKVIRRELREAKLAKRRQEALSRGECLMEVANPKSSNNTPKSLEELLNEPLPETPAHTLEVKLVRSQPSSEDFVRTFKSARQVYQKYQINIHGDNIEKCSEPQFKRFLCNSPLEQWHPQCGPTDGYGSFHHQYWLDGQLIAVGVLDILPDCISSVYLYYDPQYSFLSLGTYASLRELALTRELHRSAETLRWYYMGFYIHSCPKMRYKGNYTPSYLLCPETYVWVPIEKSSPKLEVSKYTRFNEDSSAIDENGVVDLNKVKVLFDHDSILYEMYRFLNSDADDEEEVQEYATLVGAKSAYSMFLYRR